MVESKAAWRDELFTLPISLSRHAIKQRSSDIMMWSQQKRQHLHLRALSLSVRLMHAAQRRRDSVTPVRSMPRQLHTYRPRDDSRDAHPGTEFLVHEHSSSMNRSVRRWRLFILLS